MHQSLKCNIMLCKAYDVNVNIRTWTVFDVVSSSLGAKLMLQVFLALCLPRRFHDVGQNVCIRGFECGRKIARRCDPHFLVAVKIRMRILIIHNCNTVSSTELAYNIFYILFILNFNRIKMIEDTTLISSLIL